MRVQVSTYLDITEDADLIEWVKSHSNKSALTKEALYAFMQSKGVSSLEESIVTISNQLKNIESQVSNLNLVARTNNNNNQDPDDIPSEILITMDNIGI